MVLKTERVRRGSRYEEQETGRWRYKRSSTEITETGCNKFQPLPIFSSIETARAITSSIRFSSHLFRPILSQQAEIVLMATEHVDDEIMYDQDSKRTLPRGQGTREQKT